MDHSLIFQLVVFAILFSVGWLVGSQLERRHLRELDMRERRYGSVRVDNFRFATHHGQGQLICSNVVISHDYFKYVLAQVYNFFGGRIRSYESLLERAQREAIVRLKQQAVEMGAMQIAGLRIETTTLSDQGGMVEVLAYATAIVTTPDTATR